jgi:hypothetical protein
MWNRCVLVCLLGRQATINIQGDSCNPLRVITCKIHRRPRVIQWTAKQSSRDSGFDVLGRIGQCTAQCIFEHGRLRDYQQVSITKRCTTWVDQHPGAIQFATMPFLATSRAIVFVMAETAPLEAVYPAAMCKPHTTNHCWFGRNLLTPCMPMLETIDAKFTIHPRMPLARGSCFKNCCTLYLQPRKMPRALIRIWASNSSSSTWSMGCGFRASVQMAALPTTLRNVIRSVAHGSCSHSGSMDSLTCRACHTFLPSCR